MFEELIGETIKASWPIMLMFLITALIIRILYIKNSRCKFRLYRELMNLIFLVYLYLLFTFLTRTDLNAVNGFNIKPFHEITRYDFGSNLFIFNVIGNIAAFFPLGFYIGYYVKSKKVLTTFIAALLISTSVEVIQYFIGRAFDIDDIILNVFGAILGYLVFKILYNIKKRLPNILQKDGLYSIICIIIITAMSIYFLEIMGVINIL